MGERSIFSASDVTHEALGRLKQRIPEADTSVLLEILRDVGYDTKLAARVLLGSASRSASSNDVVEVLDVFGTSSSASTTTGVVIVDEGGTMSGDEANHSLKKRRVQRPRKCGSSVDIVEDWPAPDLSRFRARRSDLPRYRTQSTSVESQINADMALALKLQEEEDLPDVVITKVSLAFCQDLEDTAARVHRKGTDVDALLAQLLQSDEDAAYSMVRRKHLELDRGLAAAFAMQEEESSAAAETARMGLEDVRFDAPQVTTLQRIVQLLSLAAPSVAQIAGLREALLAHSQDNELQGLRNGEARSLPVRREDPIVTFVGRVREEIAIIASRGAYAVDSHSYRGNLSNVRILLMPKHTEAFIRKMEALKAAGRPHIPCVAFHSTPHADARDGIAQGNFDPDKCGRHDAGYYGRGTYFHTNVPEGGAGTQNVFLALILKGREFAINYSLGCSLQQGYDSHIAADRVQTGETVIFSKDQMLPIFLFDHT